MPVISSCNQLYAVIGRHTQKLHEIRSMALPHLIRADSEALQTAHWQLSCVDRLITNLTRLQALQLSGEV